MNKRNNVKKILNLCIILVLVFVVLFSGLQILESTVFHRKEEESLGSGTRTTIVNGVEYFPRQDITVIMVLGIDQYGQVADSGSYNNDGACDMVALLILDETSQECDILYLNRDTMMEIPVLGIGGKEAGTIYAQLALAHTYGSGLEDSCENVKKALEMFLHGLTIDYYVSMNMDAISILNDAVGGVTVNVTEDFSQVDPSIPMGEVTLMGKQAITYVRSRYGVGDQLNLSRIERQKEYMTNFITAFRTAQEAEVEFLVTAYDSTASYVVTDCSLNALIGFADRYTNYTLGEIISLEGENIKGQDYMEFYVDEAALDALVLELFYAPK